MFKTPSAPHPKHLALDRKIKPSKSQMSPQGEIPFTYPINHTMRVFYLCPENWLKRRVGAGVNKRLRADMHSSLANPEEDFDGTKV
jgi:hypothetical protein